ncbi:MAG: hypothetical protein IJN29_11700 [Akkermansia sp.]|nr:hypothetical protein [Akkermansia sp.]
MIKRSILAITVAGLPALATELPPYIPSGPVSYDSVSYESPDASYDPYAPAAADSYTMSPAVAPVTPAVADGDRGYIYLNAYTSNYNVRGMGFTNDMSDWGYSSVRGSYKLPNRNLFGRGIYQRVSGSYGIVWDGGDALGDTPLINANYAIGKEIFPNLTAELGYSLNYGGIEGFMAKYHDDAPHSCSHDLNLTLRFNDGQKGFFGNMTWGWAFKGLNGIYGDIELGYRFTNVLNGAVLGADLELSAGVAPSFSYWTNGADGIDAYRIRAALPLFTHSGTVGRDARFKVIPWAQASWSGNNAAKIDRDTGYGPIDHFIITVGLDVGWHF